MTGEEFRVLVATSQWWPDPELLEQELERAWHEAMETLGLRTLVVVHGACPTGGDPVADAWAEERRQYGVRPEPHLAQWDTCAANCPPTPRHRRPRAPGDIHHPGTSDTYCPTAGPRRIRHMVSLGADLCLVAAHGDRSDGTRNCVMRAHSARIPVRVITARPPARPPGWAVRYNLFNLGKDPRDAHRRR